MERVQVMPRFHTRMLFRAAGQATKFVFGDTPFGKLCFAAGCRSHNKL